MCESSSIWVTALVLIKLAHAGLEFYFLLNIHPMIQLN